MQENKFIPGDILKSFLTSFEKGDIWQVHQLNEKRLIVFLFRDEQIELNRGLTIYQSMKNEYFKLVKQYLNTKLKSPDEISILFDSKENFDKKCEGNWYHYYH